MEIYVALPTGKIISLEEEISNTIKHVKEKIQAKEGLPSDQQLLLINTGQICEELTNDCILSDYSNSLPLRLILKLKYLKIHVNGCCFSKKNIDFQLEDLDTIGYVKQKISEHIQHYNNKLFFGDKELEDEHTLNDYNIQNKSILSLHPPDDECLQCFVSISHRRKPIVHVHLRDTVETLRTKIQEKTHLTPDQQRLSFGGIELEDGKTLDDYDICNNCTIQMLYRPRCFYPRLGNNGKLIFIRSLSGENITLQVEGSETVRELKDCISWCKNIPCVQQRWLLEGNELKDGQTLYNIQEDSTIKLSIFRKGDIQIHVKIANRTIALKAECSDTVEKVKAMISDKIHIPPDQQILTFEGKMLQDKYTLGDYLFDNYDIWHPFTFNLYSSSTLCPLIIESTNELLERLENQDQKYRILEDNQDKIVQVQKQKTVQKEEFRCKLGKLQQEQGMLITDLKLQLHIEMEKNKILNEQLQAEKLRCDYLENTVISNLLERLQTLEQSVERSQTASQIEERLKRLEDTVERLWAISRDEIILSNNILGTGGWGYVKEATYRGRKVAAKFLHKAIISPYYQELFAKEMKISARCRHQNLVEFIGAVPDHPAIIVIELMDCTLRDALADRRATPNHIHPISVDVAEGLLYLHSIQPHALIHRDVSAPNVLLKAASNGWLAKLSDLGSAQFANLAQTLAPGCVLYAAPEVQQRETARQQTVKIDVFSYGVLLIEMLTREMPKESIEALVRSVQSRWPRFVPLITSCTVTDPNQRPSMRQVIDQLDTIIM